MSNSESPFASLLAVTLSHCGGTPCSGLGEGPEIMCSPEALRGEGMQAMAAQVHCYHRRPYRCPRDPFRPHGCTALGEESIRRLALRSCFPRDTRRPLPVMSCHFLRVKPLSDMWVSVLSRADRHPSHPARSVPLISSYTSQGHPTSPCSGYSNRFSSMGLGRYKRWETKMSYLTDDTGFWPSNIS